MPSFQVLVLGFADGFLSPFPDSLPQLFLRCLPCAFAFGLFPFRSTFFRPLLFRFRLLSLCFFLSAFFPASPHSGFSGAPLPLSHHWLSPFFPTRFPVSSFSVFVLGFLFVSFRPTLIHSHSCSSGAYLVLSLSGFPLTSAFFRPLPLGSDYSAFRSFLSLLPVLP